MRLNLYTRSQKELDVGEVPDSVFQLISGKLKSPSMAVFLLGVSRWSK